MILHTNELSVKAARFSIGGLTLLLALCFVLLVLPLRVQAAPPTGVTWRDLDPNNNSSAHLSGYYKLTDNMDPGMPMNHFVDDDTYIKLDGHTITANENGTDTMFTVRSGKKLVIYGNGLDKTNLKGYALAFKMEANSTLELEDVKVDSQLENAIKGSGDNITVKLDHTQILNTQHEGSDGAINIVGKRANITGTNGSSIEKSSASHCYGGGIHIDGHYATVKGLTFKGHDTRKEGGAVWIGGIGPHVEDCTFEDNTTEVNGGGLYLYGNDAVVKDCTFKNNSAYYESGIKTTLLAISCIPSTLVDFVNCGSFSLTNMFWGEDSNQKYSGDHGGGVYIRGDNARIENIDASGNWCNEHGGTIYVEGSNGKVIDGTIKGSKSYIGGGGISMKGNNNNVDHTDLQVCVTMSYGGGIELEGDGNTVRNSTVSKSASRGDGGGIYLKGKNNAIKYTKVRGCEAEDNGGGIGVSGEKATIDNVEVGTCKARTDVGGGLYLENRNTEVSDTPTEPGHKVTDSYFYKNQSTKDHGGAIYIFDHNVDIDGCTFRGNEAGFIEDMTGDIGEKPTFTPMDAKLKKLDDASMDHGGAIFSEGLFTTVKNSTFSENCGKDGGAIYCDWREPTIENCTFTNNAAQVDGGALFFYSISTTVNDSIIRDNTALRYGGAIYYDAGKNVLKGSPDKGTSIERNKASNGKNYGHGVFVDDTDLTLGGKLIIRNNNNLDIGTIGGVTKDKIPTWSNLCLYDDAELEVLSDGIADGSEIWLDSDWGHYKKPDGGYVYRKSNSPAIGLKGFKSDRAGFHFVANNNTLYYTAGDDTVRFDDLKAPTLSRKPIDDIWTDNPGRIYIDIETPYENIDKDFTVTLAKDGGSPEPVEVKQDANGRDFVDVVGEKLHSYVYHFDLGYTAYLASPAGDTVSKDSQRTVADYQIKCESLASTVKVQSSYESIGELVVMDLGKGVEGEVFEYSGMRYPIVNNGQTVKSWKARVDGESTDRNIDVEWNKDEKSIKVTLPNDLNGREILLLPQREPVKCKVTYMVAPEGAPGIQLPADSIVYYGTEITINPLNGQQGMRTIGSAVNDEITWGRDPYTVPIRKDTLITYYADDKEKYTVTFVDDENLMQTVIPDMTHDFDPGQSFTDAGFNPRDSRYKMNVIDHFQVLHEEPVLDDEGNPTSATLGLNDPVLDNQTLKPVWVQRVMVQADERSSGSLSKEFSLDGGSKSGEQWTATLQTGDTLKAYCLPPDDKVLEGWKVYYYSWKSATNPGAGTVDVATDVVKADGQLIADSVNESGDDKYTIEGSTLKFRINEKMKAVRDGTPLRIYIRPLFRDKVTEIIGVPETMNAGESFSLKDVQILPNGAADVSDIVWNVQGPHGLADLDNTFDPEVEMAYTLEATIPNGEGAGKDYRQSFRIYVHQLNNLVFYSDIAGTRVQEKATLREGTDLAEYIGRRVYRADYNFIGWTTEPKTDGEYSYKNTLPDDDQKTPEDKEAYPYVELFEFENATMPKEGLKLYPVLVRDRLRVILDPNGGTMVEGDDGQPQATEFTVDINEKLRMQGMNTAAKYGYELDGWYTQSGVKWNENWGVTSEYCTKDPEGNPVRTEEEGKNYYYYTVELTAAWTPLEVEVVYNDGKQDSTDTSAGMARLGSTITLADAPTPEDGYLFTGWKYSAGDLHSAGEEFIFDDSKWGLVEEGKLKFTAQYEEKPVDNHTITFDTAGGPYVAPITKPEGTDVTSPADPTREGFTFLGWEPAVPATMPGKDMTCVAQWEKNISQYTLSFDTTGGTPIKPIEDNEGSKLTRPADPTKEHYVFMGWNPEFPDVMPSMDMTLSALWKPVIYTVTFDANGGTFSNGKGQLEVSDIYDAPLTTPEDPTKRGYDFVGWDTDVPAHMPGGDLVIKAKYENSANVDKQDLENAIAAAKKAEENVATSKDGKDVDPSRKWTSAAEKKTLDDAIAAAQKVADDNDATQDQIDDAAAAVKAATDAYNKARKAGSKPQYKPGEDPNQKGKDGTAVGPGASAAASDKAITNMKTDGDPKGSVFAKLRLRSVKQSKSSIRLNWNKASGATRYVIYGNACGKKNKMKKIATLTGANKKTYTVKTKAFKKATKKKLKKSTYYKFIVVGLDKNNNVVSTSKVIHVATKGNAKKWNVTRLTVTPSAIKLKINKKATLKTTIRKAKKTKGSQGRKHRKVRYESSNTKVATVGAKNGKITAKGKGTCYIYAYAQNGVYKRVKVTVIN